MPVYFKRQSDSYWLLYDLQRIKPSTTQIQTPVTHKTLNIQRIRSQNGNLPIDPGNTLVKVKVNRSNEANRAFNILRDSRGKSAPTLYILVAIKITMQYFQVDCSRDNSSFLMGTNASCNKIRDIMFQSQLVKRDRYRYEMETFPMFLFLCKI